MPVVVLTYFNTIIKYLVENTDDTKSRKKMIIQVTKHNSKFEQVLRK